MVRKKIDYNLLDYIPEEDIPDAYRKGLIGAFSEPEVMARLLGELETPLFGAAAYYLTGTGEGKVSTPYKYALKLDPGFGSTEAQTTGSCVSHGTRNAGMIDYCVDCLTENREYNGRFATENIYGARGFRGQGASGSRLAEYVHSVGGFLVRKKYINGNDVIDLSVMNERYGINWGGTGGAPTWLTNIAKEHSAKTISLVTTTEELRDCNANGYGVAVCSNYGFSSSRDSNGVSFPRGSWSHCMSVVGCDDSEWAHTNYKGSLFLICNSWGANWNSGGKHLDNPDGSFWAQASVMAKMLAQRGSFVISNVEGFKKRKLDYMLI